MRMIMDIGQILHLPNSTFWSSMILLLNGNSPKNCKHFLCFFVQCYVDLIHLKHSFPFPFSAQPFFQGESVQKDNWSRLITALHLQKLLIPGSSWSVQDRYTKFYSRSLILLRINSELKLRGRGSLLFSLWVNLKLQAANPSPVTCLYVWLFNF